MGAGPSLGRSVGNSNSLYSHTGSARICSGPRQVGVYPVGNHRRVACGAKESALGLRPRFPPNQRPAWWIRPTSSIEPVFFAAPLSGIESRHRIQTPSRAPVPRLPLCFTLQRRTAAVKKNEPTPVISEERKTGSDLDAPDLDSTGPILADYLTVGWAVSSSSASTVRPFEAKKKPLPSPGRPSLPLGRKPISFPIGGKPSQAQQDAPVQERFLFAKALEPSKALELMPQKNPPRVPKGFNREKREAPRLFEEGYAGFARSIAAENAKDVQSSGVDGNVPSASGSAKKPQWAYTRARRLRVETKHRKQLNKILCNAVLRNFLQEHRHGFKLNPGQPPLWFWEARRAQDLSRHGRVSSLVAYLVETEVHMKCGPERKNHFPKPGGNANQVEIRLTRERKSLEEFWNSNGTRLDRLRFEDDVFMRLFLDGLLSWQRTRDMVGGQSLLAQVLPPEVWQFSPTP